MLPAEESERERRLHFTTRSQHTPRAFMQQDTLPGGSPPGGRRVRAGGDGGVAGESMVDAAPRAGRARASLHEDGGATTPAAATAATSSGVVAGGPSIGAPRSDATAAGSGRRSSYRATSGSEVGLELDPQAAKVVEVYGFAGWIATFVGWSAYMVWAYLPESVMRAAGVTYYPNKYWASAAPALLVSLVCVYGLIYGAIGLLNNPHITSWTALSDGYSKQLVPPQSPGGSASAGGATTARGKEGSEAAPEPPAVAAQDWRFMSTPEISDLPLTLVNRLQFMS